MPAVAAPEEVPWPRFPPSWLTEETAAETMADPGTSGAAMAAPDAMAPPTVCIPAARRSPKSAFGVWRSMVRLVEMRTGVESIRVGFVGFDIAVTSVSFWGLENLGRESAHFGYRGRWSFGFAGCGTFLSHTSNYSNPQGYLGFLTG